MHLQYTYVNKKIIFKEKILEEWANVCNRERKGTNEGHRIMLSDHSFMSAFPLAGR